MIPNGPSITPSTSSPPAEREPGSGVPGPVADGLERVITARR
jgi:hypothetical protein